MRHQESTENAVKPDTEDTPVSREVGVKVEHRSRSSIDLHQTTSLEHLVHGHDASAHEFCPESVTHGRYRVALDGTRLLVWALEGDVDQKLLLSTRRC
jgi:hypothetical protein